MHRKVLHNQQAMWITQSKTGFDICGDVAQIIAQTVGRIGKLFLDAADAVEHGGVILAEFLGDVRQRKACQHIPRFVLRQSIGQKK